MSYQNNKIQRSRYLRNPIVLSSPDNSITFVVVFLIIIGFLAIFSAAAPKCIAQGLNPAYFVIRHLIWCILGIFGLIYFLTHDYKNLSRYSVKFAWIVVGLLALTHIFGVTVNGATRWLGFGPFQFQPSELAKPAVILLLATAFSKDAKLFSQEKILKYYLPIIIMLLLIIKQPNLSMVIILSCVSGAIYFLSGGSLKLLGTLIGVGVTGIIYSLQSFQMSRIEIWKHPEIDPYGAGYNIIQSMIAFVAGGWFGEGYGNSRQKLGWLPEAHTDFIYAVLGEEFGFMGCLLIIWLFVMLLYKGLLVSKKCTNIFGKLLAAGITLCICIQALINMAVSSSAVPATGVPMPFISYGGTSLFVSMSMIGILLNVSRKRIRKIEYNEQAEL